MITLHNIHTIQEGIKNVTVKDGRVINIFSPGKDHENNNGAHLYFNDALIFPGLINSHDHLDFNLFPKLGNRIYKNYVEWGNDIHQQNKETIDAVLKIPKKLRAQWGIYKNLLNGITAVFNHGKKLQIENSL